MKAISFTLPWPYLFFPECWDRVPQDRRTLGPAGVALPGPKDCENRRAAVANQFLEYRGQLAIQVSRSVDDNARSWCDWFGLPADLPTGVVIGTVDVRGKLFRGPLSTTGFSPWHEPCSHAIYVHNPQLFARPIPARGHIGAWEIPEAELVPPPEPAQRELFA